MSDLESLYQQVILDHYKSKHGFGDLPEDAHASSYQVNPTCGDEVTVSVKMTATGEIEELIWHGDGCSISQASLSMMTDLVVGKPRAEVDQLMEYFRLMMHAQNAELDDEILDALEDAAVLQGVAKYTARIKCALLGWMALKDALRKIDEAK